MHHIVKAADIVPVDAYEENAKGFKRAVMAGRECGAVHTCFSKCRLASGGYVERHVHSFEELFYVTEGSPVLIVENDVHRLRPGAAGVLPVGKEHAWLGGEEGPAEWIELQTPIPRNGHGAADTLFLGPPNFDKAASFDIRDPRIAHLFHMAEDDIQVDKLKLGSRVDAPKVSASMATALLAYSGIAVKMLVDQRLSAALGNMFMVEYQPGGAAHPHDHPVEEAYYIIDGEVEAVADGETYLLGPGDAMWTGVGCIHAFYNRSNRTVRWLETQTPLPPARNSYRFERDWEYLAEKLAGRNG